MYSYPLGYDSYPTSFLPDLSATPFNPPRLPSVTALHRRIIWFNSFLMCFGFPSTGTYLDRHVKATHIDQVRLLLELTTFPNKENNKTIKKVLNRCKKNRKSPAQSFFKIYESNAKMILQLGNVADCSTPTLQSISLSPKTSQLT